MPWHSLLYTHMQHLYTCNYTHTHTHHTPHTAHACIVYKHRNVLHGQFLTDDPVPHSVTGMIVLHDTTMTKSLVITAHVINIAYCMYSTEPYIIHIFNEC